ncbi:MAG: DNA-directed DNA polymerase II small subunit [Methanobacteriales archaeon]|nr:DNA-directed DNA polymerase II small subunit [Methanobacteriales archaeon]MBC7118249.1 DNA-directed DNA polymerase II small subunit [Methanobacteriaceae archaeon]
MSRDILLRLAEDGLLVQPEAYEKMKLLGEETILNLIENLKSQRKDGELLIITPEILSMDSSDQRVDLEARGAKKFDFKIIKDTSMKSYTTGEIKDMGDYFNSRYNKLKEIFLGRGEFRDFLPISSVSPRHDVVTIIGMIREIRDTKNNHKIIEIEDETGEINLLVHKENRKLFEEANRLVRDEVIGVKGSLKGRFVIPSEIVHPGLPRIEEKPMDFSTVFISDTHIGSSTFLEESFKKFIKWLNCELGTKEHMKIAEDVKYLIIAGDIVDGIGVYPNQEKELIIKDVNEQYEEAARLIGEIRDDIKIIIAPGNHDASRIAEPQPAIPKEYAKPLYQIKNIEFVSNPSIVSLDGVKVLIYHGRSFDDMAMTVNHLSHDKSHLIMAELLEKRHLAPIYGERTPIAYEVEDHLVIDEIPHIFHAGHVHINAYKKYKGIHLINSGTFQSQTEFQKIYNIVPTCGQVPVLHRGEIKVLQFN